TSLGTHGPRLDLEFAVQQLRRRRLNVAHPEIRSLHACFDRSRFTLLTPVVELLLVGFLVRILRRLLIVFLLLCGSETLDDRKIFLRSRPPGSTVHAVIERC